MQMIWPEEAIHAAKNGGEKDQCCAFGVDYFVPLSSLDKSRIRTGRGSDTHRHGVRSLRRGHGRPGSVPVLVGREASDLRPLDIAIPRRDASGRGCWSSPRR